MTLPGEDWAKFEIAEFGLGEIDGFASRNGAALDPFVDGGLYEKYVEMVVQPEEIQGEYIDPEWSREIDEYCEQLEIPFDEPDIYKAIGESISKFRWAAYLQDSIEHYFSTADYHVGLAEKRDTAEMIVEDRIERARDEAEVRELRSALEIWRDTHGNF